MTVRLSSQELSDLVGQIYDCTLAPDRWETTLHAIKDSLLCEYAFLRLDNLATHTSLVTRNAGIEPAWLECLPALAPEVAEILVQVLISGHSQDAPSIASQYMTREEIDATQFHQKWGQPQGIADYMGLFLLQSPTRLAALELGRHERHGVLTGCEAALATLLIPHLRRAVTISNALDLATVEKERLAETLDTLRLGVVLADEDSRILHANRSAETMMRDGGFVRDGGGRLTTGSAAASAEIKTAIGMAARNESGIGKTGLAVRLSHESAAPAVAHVLPLARGEVRTRLDPAAVAAVFINTGGEDEARLRGVTAAFALTPAEARVLSRILSGRNVNEAAHDLGVAASTVRTHLDNVFSKTGVTRQAELIRLAARMAPATL